jgi:hypothetical protein
MKQPRTLVKTYAQNSSAGGPGLTIPQAVRTLRRTFLRSINFVTLVSSGAVELPPSATSLEAALDSLIQQTDDYRWAIIRGHYVFYPTEPIWDEVISGVVITSSPRIDAATEYIELVHDLLPPLSNLQPPVILGNPGAMLYAERVSLSNAAPLVEHLVELLGTNVTLAFAIEPALSGVPVLNFERI